MTIGEKRKHSGVEDSQQCSQAARLEGGTRNGREDSGTTSAQKKSNRALIARIHASYLAFKGTQDLKRNYEIILEAAKGMFGFLLMCLGICCLHSSVPLQSDLTHALFKYVKFDFPQCFPPKSFLWKVLL
jgi:hypothetical protein